jgi:hypothetical protein
MWHRWRGIHAAATCLRGRPVWKYAHCPLAFYFIHTTYPIPSLRSSTTRRSLTLSFTSPIASSHDVLLHRHKGTHSSSLLARTPLIAGATTRSSAVAHTRPRACCWRHTILASEPRPVPTRSLPRLHLLPPLSFSCDAPPPDHQRAVPDAKGEVNEGEREAGQHAYFHTVQPPHVCWCCIDSTSAMPYQQKGHPVAFWTCGAHLDKFRDLKVHFQSWWAYLTQHYKLKGLPCILLLRKANPLPPYELVVVFSNHRLIRR